VLNLDAEFFASLFQIVLFDLVLSGDNAVVIGMAARNLSEHNRRRAIIIGGGGAIGLRIGFTLIASFLLDVPALQVIGGILLLWIAFKLLRPQAHAENVSEAGSLGEAIRTIILADVVMSLDNILAISGAAHGHENSQVLVIIGLALSIPLLLVGSDVVSRLLGRVPILVFAGAILLVWAAIRMIAHDDWVEDYVRHFSAVEIVAITAVASAVVVLLAQYTTRRMRAAEAESARRQMDHPDKPAAADRLGWDRLRPRSKTNPDEAQAG
jgi:YjbE family integral membrane protein